MNGHDGPTYGSNERTKAAMDTVADLAAEYEGQEGRLEFYGTATVEALSEHRERVDGEVDYRDLLVDVDPVATTTLAKVRKRHVDAVDTVRRVHDGNERVVTVVVPEE
jgi:hypothetical protein